MAYLKQLEINGFKSFANPTTFVFDYGITAIIGPNGSGKSNIAEALRWVLGEQQYSNLRSRRTEDVIFGGSDQRGRMGLAEVSLTIDNSSGALPIEYSEIKLTRRAHRSGENQYLINGNRVRLRDIQQLTSPLGQAHTIVGQGLVDAVLSQRPEDRRGLFEHAAGITGLRMQTVSAERGLAEAEGNAQRLRDIISELEPRVRSLARRARQAQQYESVRAKLIDVQRGYYGALWLQAQDRLRAAEQHQRAAAASVEEREMKHAAARQKLASLRERERRLSGERATEVERLSAMETDLSGARHRLELLRIESRAAADRAAERSEAQHRHESEQSERRIRLAEIERDIAAQLADLEERQSDHDRRAAEQAEAFRSRSALEEDLARIDGDRQRQTDRLNQLEAELAGARERSLVLQRSIDDLEERLAHLNEQISRLQRDIAQANEEVEAAAALVASTRSSRDQTERQLDEIETALRQEQTSLHEIERDLDRHRGRLELLDRVWAEGEGLHAGVRSILRAARQGDLDVPGLIGTVAESVDVPKEFETAIEVALGGHLQDIIVRDWVSATVGIEYLKSTRSGRARFQPLDSIRRYRPRSLNGAPAGLIDRATSLVNVNEECAPVIDQLLGRTLVARDLEAAHEIARAVDGWTIVTLQGELVAPSGSVTGGSRIRGAGLLARERERRGLPVRIAELQNSLAAARSSMKALQRRQEREVDALKTLDEELTDARGRERDAAERLRRGRREIDGERATVARQQGELELLRRDLAQITASATPLSDERDRLAARLQNLHDEREQIICRLDALPSPDDQGLRQLTTALATLRERVRSSERERTELQSQIERASADQTRREEELARIHHRRAELDLDASQLQASIDALERELVEAREGIPPINNQLATLQSEINTLEMDVEERARDLRERERQFDQAVLDVARAGDAVDLLRSRILDDLDMPDPDSLHDLATEATEDVEASIRRLRERLRRMGSVGDDVIVEYEEESERLDHLASQLGDVEGAASSLRAVLDDLRRQMGSRFVETFEGVAKEFEATFKRLFGGGAAKLSHDTEASDLGGIDIVARPPGKRLQGLNQLSGGERALTAVALLIAIQRVNPSPFCLLDEVDAALDESNVIRFRQELRELARDTQYIVITHNRGTIEGADTLYGVTMGPDSVSRVLSLRLDQAIQAIEDDQLLELESVI